MLVFSQSSKPMRPYKGNSTLKFADNYTVIDIETTGLSPRWDSIIELSAVKVENNVIISQFSELVNPGFPIPEFITNLTGISNEMVENCPPISDVLPDFLKFVKNSLIVGHNVNFDINFIYDNASDYLDEHFPNDFVDTMRLGRRLIDGLPHYKLQNLAEYFNVDYSGAHRALEDCKITYMCYEGLKKIVSDNPEKADALKYDKYYNSTRAKNVHTDVLNFDEDHPLFGKVCVITGELSSTRAEAMQAIADVGGINADSVTQKTNYLIVGGYEYSHYGKDFKSNKRKKAEEYKLNGLDIEIISEDVFISMLNKNEEDKMSEQLTLYKFNIDSNALQTINDIIRYTASETGYDLKYFSIEPNFKNKDTENEKLIGYSLLLDKSLYAKTNLDLSEIIVKKSLLYDNIKGAIKLSSVSSPKDSIKIQFETPAYGIEYLKFAVRKYAEIYIPLPRFGCCDLYVKCSDAKGCIANDKFHAKSCLYRENLEKGMIFYGKNANQ